MGSHLADDHIKNNAGIHKERSKTDVERGPAPSNMHAYEHDNASKRKHINSGTYNAFKLASGGRSHYSTGIQCRKTMGDEK